jgi:hypothetical protein
LASTIAIIDTPNNSSPFGGPPRGEPQFAFHILRKNFVALFLSHFDPNNKNYYFFGENICSYQKKAVPLQRFCIIVC